MKLTADFASRSSNCELRVTLALAFFLTLLPGCSKPDSQAEAPDDSEAVGIVSVQTGVLQAMTLHRYVSGYGWVEPAAATTDQPAAEAQLAAPAAGVVDRVLVVEGQHVEKGEVLAEFNSGATTAALAEQEVARQKKLFAQQNTSQRNLQNAEAQLALLQVVAPLAGTVTRVNVKPGGAVDTTTVVAELMDLNRLAVRTDIPAADAASLPVGAKLETLTQPPVTAPVIFVSPTVDANSGTVRVRASLPADSGLRPGQFVPVRIITAIHTNCLAAPEASVVTDESGHSVVSLVQGDTAMPVPVQTGFRENGWVEVSGAGLQAGASVVTIGAYGLPNKTKIQIVNPAATSSPPAP